MSEMFGGACCPVLTTTDDDKDPGGASRFAQDIERFIDKDSDNINHINMIVDGIHCGGCILSIEKGLMSHPGVTHARVNMSTNRLRIAWQTESCDPLDFIRILARLGYKAVPYDPALMKSDRTAHEKNLLMAMAVAGFAASNVMLLSVAIWAGHFSDMGPHTRTLMHWISAFITIPAVLYAGQPFFRSALTVLKQGRTNMDVPISLAVLLATGMSLSETMRGADHAYFDSAITLLFFLLIGRYLDIRARGKARSAAEKLLSLNAVAVTVLQADGTTTILPPESVKEGMIVLVSAGERVSVDGTVTQGVSDIDTSVISGETIPRTVNTGDQVFAGTMNLNGVLQISVNAVGEATLLAEIARLMENAEQRRSRFVSIADRVARAYAPVVHSLAAVTFIGWVTFSVVGWQDSLMTAIAVLIITCPCALGLAVPIVQVVASGRLLKAGILLKSASAMERLSEIDTIVFDKTGTLTEGQPELIDNGTWSQDDLNLAAGAATLSKHPLSKALTSAATNISQIPNTLKEMPGAGLSWEISGAPFQLGSRNWIKPTIDSPATGPELFFKKPDGVIVHFQFQDKLRSDASEIVSLLMDKGIQIELLSGDREETVAQVANQLNIQNFKANQSPADKLQYLSTLRESGIKACMIGDGINDAPALAEAHVSISPTSASDISQTTADVLFQGSKLSPVIEVLMIGRQAQSLVKQNFGLAFLYNVLTVPLAMAGFVTPLFAAVAMSSSSLVVIANALRLGWFTRKFR